MARSIAATPAPRPPTQPTIYLTVLNVVRARRALCPRTPDLPGVEPAPRWSGDGPVLALDLQPVPPGETDGLVSSGPLLAAATRDGSSPAIAPGELTIRRRIDEFTGGALAVPADATLVCTCADLEACQAGGCPRPRLARALARSGWTVVCDGELVDDQDNQEVPR